MMTGTESMSGPPKYGGGSDEPESARERVAVFSFASIAVSHEESGPRGRDLLIAEPSTEKECPRRLVRTDYRASDPKTPVRIRARALQGEISSMTPKASANSNAISQPVATPLTRAAIFLVVTVNPGAENRDVIRRLCKDLTSLVRSAGFRELEGSLSCVMAVGSETWDRLVGETRPAEVRKVCEVPSGGGPAPSTPGGLLLPLPAPPQDPGLRAAAPIIAPPGSGGVSRTRGKPFLRHGGGIGNVGPAVRATAACRVAKVSRDPCGRAPRSFDPGRSALPHPSAAHGPVLRAGDTDHGSAGKRGLPRGRGPRISLL